MLLCSAVCCSVLQCVAVCCSWADSVASFVRGVEPLTATRCNTLHHTTAQRELLPVTQGLTVLFLLCRIESVDCVVVPFDEYKGLFQYVCGSLSK